MSTYFSVPTPVGLAEMNSAVAAGQKALFDQIAIGDGGGAAVNPTGRTSLVRQVDIVPVVSVRVHPANAAWQIVEAVIPETKGGYTIRELALVGGSGGGKVLSVSNYPDLALPAPGNGVGSAVVVRMVVAFAGAGTVNLTMNSSAYATLQAVLDQVAAHEAKADPHPQYTTTARAAAAAATAAASAVSAHEAKNDPHPQYTTAAEAAAAANSAAAGAVTTHEGKADPHPQYTTTEEANAAVASAVSTHEGKSDPHPQYTTAPEAAAAASSAVSGHEGKTDPHPQYTTAAEAAAAAASAVAAHEAKADPHPQYVTQPEGDTRYALLGALLTADVLKALRGARAFRYFNT